MTVLDRRKTNIQRSPKRGGSCEEDSRPYLDQLGISITENKQPIQFTGNANELVHRWAPYVQGFSAAFVQSTFHRFRGDYQCPRVLDPFAGCGTVLVQAKMSGYESFGVEFNPLMRYITDVKLNSWFVSPRKLLEVYQNLKYELLASEPSFLKSENHFNPLALFSLKRIKGAIDLLTPSDAEQARIKDLLTVAFSAILIDCSNLKRTPCLGYWKDKSVDEAEPFRLFNNKVMDIVYDLEILQSDYRERLSVRSEVVRANSMEYDYESNYDLVITSPPYMNGLDYVMNYKIEMAWLGFISSHKEAKAMKDVMVVCDNVSKGVIRNFAGADYYTNDWLDAITDNINRGIKLRTAYRREDMAWIVKKYFDDMNRVILKVAKSLNAGARFILVVGDSLIADTYVPTDLILAKIATEHGLKIEAIELARHRRSGQIRDYRLRETVVILRK